MEKKKRRYFIIDPTSLELMQLVEFCKDKDIRNHGYVDSDSEKNVLRLSVLMTLEELKECKLYIKENS